MWKMSNHPSILYWYIDAMQWTWRHLWLQRCKVRSSIANMILPRKTEPMTPLIRDQKILSQTVPNVGNSNLDMKIQQSKISREKKTCLSKCLMLTSWAIWDFVKWSKQVMAFIVHTTGIPVRIDRWYCSLCKIDVGVYERQCIYHNWLIPSYSADISVN